MGNRMDMRHWTRRPLAKSDSGNLRRYCRLRRACGWSFLRVARKDGRLYVMMGLGLIQCNSSDGSARLKRYMAEGRLFIALDEVK